MRTVIVTGLLGQVAWTCDPARAARLYRWAFKQAEPGSETHVEAGRGLGAALEKPERRNWFHIVVNTIWIVSPSSVDREIRSTTCTKRSAFWAV
jgi:hypothetical protein